MGNQMNNPWVRSTYKMAFLRVNKAVATRMLGGEKVVEAILNREVVPLQRSVQMAAVKKYAAMMTEGKWDQVELQSPLRFTTKGVCFDGKHRLLAVILADVALDLKVESGLDIKDPQELIHIDTGFARDPRNTGEVIMGKRVTVRGMAIATRMMCSIGADKNTTHEDRVRFYQVHEGVINFVESHSTGGTKGLASPVLAAVARAVYTHRRERLTRFLEIVATGEYEASVPGELMAVKLRTYMMEQGATGNGIRTLLYWKTEVALKHFLAGQDVGKLQVPTNPKELFPLPSDDKKRDKK